MEQPSRTSKKRSGTVAGMKDGLKKATTDMLVLFLLRQKPMYAYEMLQEMTRLSDGVLQFNTLYIAIYRLQEHGYISPSETVVTESNRTRVYFSITEQGSGYLDDIIAEYRRVTQTIDSLLSKDGVLYEGDSV
ncbi:PadR family transcriptional regulator [Ruthenibacterium lactatiformans]|uniref:PadR family transcriptional regulator n=1 Tax=Ruthenibacterium lactatiformans TaxID=1550024 RepID=UPI001064F73D|nr:PadR family transcriptional regulator [Ruthenibacterium lactatiformans]